MSETELNKPGKASSPRSRLKYIVTRLKELKDEKTRLTEERASIRAAIAAEKGESGAPAQGGRGKRREKKPKSEETADED